MSYIILDNVSVRFPIYDSSNRSFRRSLLHLGVGGTISRGRGRMDVRALENISLEIRTGDRVGLIGHNGAGKSTLLRILSGIRAPTAGTVSIQGKTSALLSLGSILDPEMTGVENIHHACVLLDIPAKRQNTLVDEVIELTELGAFIDLPVKTYSAGMQMRLSFALMTSQEPDILIMDEVFSVGDRHFQEKTSRRMLELQENAKILIVASHNDNQIRSMCNKAVWLVQGRIQSFGPVEDVINAYRTILSP